MTTTALIRYPDLAGRAQGTLLQQWANSPRLVAFARALGSGAQILEDSVHDVLLGAVLMNATHNALDQWGDLVGERRMGLPDGQYRGFISARILANRSSGKLDELIRIAQMITGESTIGTGELYPKHLTMYVYRNSFMDNRWRRRVHAMLFGIKPAGTFLELIEVVPSSFGFAAPYFGLSVGSFARLI